MHAAHTSTGICGLGTTVELLRLLNCPELNIAKVFPARRQPEGRAVMAEDLRLTQEYQQGMLNILFIGLLMDPGVYKIPGSEKTVHINDLAGIIYEQIDSMRALKGAQDTLLDQESDLRKDNLYMEYLSGSVFTPHTTYFALSIKEIADLTQIIIEKLNSPGRREETKQALKHAESVLRGQMLENTSTLGSLAAMLFSNMETSRATKLQAEEDKQYAQANANQERGESGKYRKLEPRELIQCGPHQALLARCLETLKSVQVVSYENSNLELRNLILAKDPQLMQKINTALTQFADFFENVRKAELSREIRTALEATNPTPPTFGLSFT